MNCAYVVRRFLGSNSVHAFLGYFPYQFIGVNKSIDSVMKYSHYRYTLTRSKKSLVFVFKLLISLIMNKLCLLKNKKSDKPDGRLTVQISTRALCTPPITLAMGADHV